VLFHELSYLPLPFLAGDLVAAAAENPELVQRVLDACAIAPGQRGVARRALAELQARELARLAGDGSFAAALALQGRWLPGRDHDSALLRGFSEAARFLAAADGTYLPHLAQQHLDDAERQLAAIDNLRVSSREPLARFAPTVLAAFRQALAVLRERSARAAAETLPNPFVTGNPISGALHWGRQVFRGREGVVRQIEGLLGDRQNSAALALIGPRRCGKSSLLNMFRLLLAETQIVLFDLQDNPATTPAVFYRALAEQARVQADRDRRLRLPAFPDGAPIEALRAWFDALENLADAPRILICIDEFERLASLFPASGNELLQFMGLLRATIQHRRRVRLLVAGAAPFDELDALWNDHFINLREIRIGYLERATAVELLVRPIDDFPPETIPRAIAEAAVARSGGQPYLTQLYGSLLVDHLNAAQRRSATAADLAAVEEELLDQAGYYFRNVWQDLPAAAQAIVAAAARADRARRDAPAGDAATRRILRRRQILGEDGELLVPVFARWIHEQHFTP
jgi:energy-coupling factor transporter ATP-binding protein EcfA2